MFILNASNATSMETKKKEKRKKHWRKSVKRLFHISLVAGHECNIQIGKHSLICLVRDATDAKAYSSLHNIEFHITEDCVVWGPHYGGVVCSSFFFSFTSSSPHFYHLRWIGRLYAQCHTICNHVVCYFILLSLTRSLFFFIKFVIKFSERSLVVHQPYIPN